MSGRWRDCWISFRALPQWVQWWVGAVLVPVNALPFALLDTPTGRWGACAALFVVATNIPIMLDLIDSWRWWRGERAVPGRPSA